MYHKVIFSYNNPDYNPGSTVCTIYSSDRLPVRNSEAEQVNGIAFLSARDKFNKKIGRKIAFTRALNTLFPGVENKQIRSKLWKQYRDNQQILLS